ncbi:flagellar biosynthetic protein FliO [Paralcaligenes sp. KSB-10]|jgi:flagellar protein FliO/FliZ|uniref:flagellar biosynthetic protein FliO n=1 Tax=Paralcaligenes sp. KSB-10 TaxID=2901142 RepID=UPI001E3E56B7|nr:flagellar biosynthetic protein FliO [Paralcaligenes sp. KSB-10]UHL65301.1 flagellar biosynthetic protein FliO [Paralcaligenes sp. KSB-10]
MTEAAALRLILSLFFVLALILAGAWLTRRAGWLHPGTKRMIKLIDTQNLGSRTYVALVDVEDTRLVLGVTTSHVSLLHTLPRPENEPMQAEHAPAFARTLRHIMAKRR